MKPRIFISYRRDDASAPAGRVCDRLKRTFGAGRVKIDVEFIDAGVDYIQAVQEAVGEWCDVLITVIGPDWSSIKGREGNKRLDDPNDLVRIEIATALRRGILVIPVLVDGAEMPRPEEIPPDLSELLKKNGTKVRHDSFDPDMNRLEKAIRKARKAPRETRRRARGKGKLLAGAAVVLVAIAIVLAISQIPDTAVLSARSESRADEPTTEETAPEEPSSDNGPGPLGPEPVPPPPPPVEREKPTRAEVSLDDSAKPCEIRATAVGPDGSTLNRNLVVEWRGAEGPPSSFELQNGSRSFAIEPPQLESWTVKVKDTDGMVLFVDEETQHGCPEEELKLSLGESMALSLEPR